MIAAQREAGAGGGRLSTPAIVAQLHPEAFAALRHGYGTLERMLGIGPCHGPAGRWGPAAPAGLPAGELGVREPSLRSFRGAPGPGCA